MSTHYKYTALALILLSLIAISIPGFANAGERHDHGYTRNKYHGHHQQHRHHEHARHYRHNDYRNFQYSPRGSVNVYRGYFHGQHRNHHGSFFGWSLHIQ